MSERLDDALAGFEPPFYIGSLLSQMPPVAGLQAVVHEVAASVRVVGTNAEQLFIGPCRIVESLQRGKRSGPIDQRFEQIGGKRERLVETAQRLLLTVEFLEDAAAIAPRPGKGRVDRNDRLEGFERF